MIKPIHWEMAKKIACKITSNYDDQQDIISTAILKLYTRLTKQQESKGLSYEFVILRSGAIDWCRSTYKKKKRIDTINFSAIDNLHELQDPSDTLDRKLELISLEQDRIYYDDLDLLKNFVECDNDLASLAKLEAKTKNAVTVEIHRKRKNWQDGYQKVKDSANQSLSSEDSRDKI